MTLLLIINEIARDIHGASVTYIITGGHLQLSAYKSQDYR